MAEDYCDIHKCQMKKYEKDDRSWYSHQVKDDARFPKGWCSGAYRDEKKNGKDDSPRIRLKLYELGLNYAPGDIPSWLRMAEDYVFNGKIPTKNIFPQEESQEFPQEEQE